jgi:threonine dehydrogenase-like Zn-dependent dehydrogenase
MNSANGHIHFPHSERYAKQPSQVAVEDRPYPNIQKPTDAILKVSSTALCGSDLHFYRGHLKCPPDFICGHEFVGEIVEKGDSVSKFNIGDKVCELKRRAARSAEL